MLTSYRFDNHRYHCAPAGRPRVAPLPDLLRAVRLARHPPAQTRQLRAHLLRALPVQDTGAAARRRWRQGGAVTLTYQFCACPLATPAADTADYADAGVPELPGALCGGARQGAAALPTNYALL